MNEDLRWKVEKIKEIHDCRIFKLEETSSLSPLGETRNFFRINSPDWVTIIPVIKEIPERELLLVRQFRHGSGSLSLEFPAGMVDHLEPPENAARRELLEETGYIADKWTLIGSTNPNPAFMTNTTHTYLAQGLRHKSKQNTDHDEFIETIIKSESEVSSLMGKPPFESAIMVQAYFFFLRALSKERLL